MFFCGYFYYVGIRGFVVDFFVFCEYVLLWGFCKRIMNEDNYFYYGYWKLVLF